MSNVEILALEINQNAGNEKLAKKHITSIDYIESQTKLNLLPNLTKRERKRVETITAKDIWDSRLDRHGE